MTGMPIAIGVGMNSTTRILILDNDPKAADALGRLLELYYPSVRCAVGFTGLSTVHLACSDAFDIVIIELHLGEDDGVDVAKAIRMRRGTDLPKIIAISSNRARVAIERSQSLFDLAFDKPLVVGELRDVVYGH